MVINRKIIRIGYSHMMNLPKYWIEQQKLQKGDSVEVTILQNGGLLITRDKIDATQ